jgi:Family of unknown function (DUF6196)
MYISLETPDQTYARLIKVIGQAELVIYEKPYAFVEHDVSNFPQNFLPEALAFVRDENVWSALVPSSTSEQEQFIIFAFHFTPGLDNSGFVGWLASHLESRIGTGVFVICGQNSERGGIFDYWGAPVSVAKQVLAEIHRLRETSFGS